MNNLITKQDPQEVFAGIEKKCSLHPAAFLRDNYNNLSIREASSLDHFDSTFATMLLKIFALSGIKGEVDDLNAQDIKKFILSACNALTLEEIYKAFELERFGAYGQKNEHFNLFNSVYVAQVVKNYKNWKIEQRRIHQIEKKMEVEEISESKKKEIVDSGIIRNFNEFVELGTLPDAYVFDVLFERKLIKGPETPALLNYYNKKQQQAAIQLEASLRTNKKLESDPNDRKAIALEIDNILKGNSDKINIRAKSIIASEYFEKLIQQKKDINEIIK